MRLIEASADGRVPFLDMAREFREAGDERYALALDDFDAYLAQVECYRRGEGLPANLVPGRVFWAEEAGSLVAGLRLRLRLNPELTHEGGHIGYDVRPSARRRGHGTQLLALGLARARANGISPVRLTVDADNVGSIRIIEKNGGVLAGTGVSSHSGKPILQFWVHS